MTEELRKKIAGGGGREYFDGAICKGDTYIHIGYPFPNITECGKSIQEFMLTYADVEITCPDCIKKARKSS